MQTLDYEKPLAEWLEKNGYSEILSAYENYLGENLTEIYFLDLRTWLHRVHPDILIGRYESESSALKVLMLPHADRIKNVTDGISRIR